MIEELEADVTRNADAIDSVVFASFDDVKAYIKQTIFPLMTNVVDEIAGIDDELAEFLEGQGTDVLTPETAGIFSAVTVHCIQLCNALKKLKPNNVTLNAKIDAIRQVCQLAQKTIMEITVMPEGEVTEPTEPEMPTVPEAAANEEVLDGNA